MHSKHVKWLIWAAALVGSPVAAQSAGQFDLVCSGFRQTGINGPEEPLDYRIRVDLDGGRWCWDKCEKTYEFADVGPDRIVFAEESIDTLRKRSTSRNEVSRQTGDHELIWIETRPFPTYVHTKGHCEPRAFSGFPVARF